MEAMKLLHLLIFFISVSTVICTSGGYSWFMAQQKCRQENSALSSDRSNQLSSTYWTGMYKRLSRWIKIIGCYDASYVWKIGCYDLNLLTASVGLCQGHCWMHNHSTFGIKANNCICLPDNISGPQHNPNSCNLNCSHGEHFPRICGGHSTFNVFVTDGNLLESQFNCVSLQCPHKANAFWTRISCSSYLRSICSTSNSETDEETSLGWVESMNMCRTMKSSYLMGNVSLSDATKACKEIKGSFSDQRWIGVFRVEYLGEDKGHVILEEEQRLYKTCEQCVACQNDNCSFECDFIDCRERFHTEISCIDIRNKTEPVTHLSTERTSKTSPSINTKSTHLLYTNTNVFSTTPLSTDSAVSNKENRHISSPDESYELSIIVPVVLVIVLVVVCVILGIIYIRRKNQKLSKHSTETTNSSRTKDEDYSPDTKNKPDHNYFCLEPSNPIYQLADNTECEPESPYNETEEGTYDHLRGDTRRKSVDDTYHHTSSIKTNDYSDYDVTHHTKTDQQESHYDHADTNGSLYNELNSLRSSKPS